MGPRSRLARFLFQAPITGTDREIAAFHETARQNDVKQILLHVFFLSKYRFIQGTLVPGPAQNQYIGATGVNQAAHCVPCQILSGGQALQRLITRADALEIELENLFADTHDIHLKFNRADKSSEDRGLTTAFAAACNQVASVARFARFGVVEQMLHYIDEAYMVYKTQGLAAFDRAIAAQRAEMMAGKPLSGTTRQEVISILEIYRNTLQTSQHVNTLDTVQGLFPKDVWDDYSALARQP
jgi:hypothetical protein